MKRVRSPEVTVLPVHFEDRSGTEFERRGGRVVMFREMQKGNAGVSVGSAS
jgi:hypothetical protein